MTRRDVGVVVGFAVLYAVAALVGRATLVGGDGGVSLVWPAAGVALLWLMARGSSRHVWVDIAVLCAVSWVVTDLTGASTAEALGLTAAAVVQAVSCALLVRHWCPRLWNRVGSAAVVTVEELWRLLAAAGISSVLSAPVALVAVGREAGMWQWDVLTVWSVRNTVSILVVGTLGLGLRAWLADRRAWTTVAAESGRVSGARVAEYIAALMLTPVMYALWFLELEDVPVAFPLIALTVWAGTRLHTWFVILHDTAMGVTAVVLTIAGLGPFAAIGDEVTQVLVAQAYVGLVAVIGLVLALARDQRDALAVALGSARDEARSQATLLTTIVDTMAEGVAVVAPDGSVVLRNQRANRLLGGVDELAGPGTGRASYGLLRLDGGDLGEDELPYARALAGHRVRDMDLLARGVDDPSGRVLSFNSALLPPEVGGGVVTLMRDVTAEREERGRATQVQASLLPAAAPHVPGYRTAARFVPAGSVGGDFYDWETTPAGLVVTIADVMGKGMGAAILAATSRAALRSHPGDDDVATTLDAAERAIGQDLVNAGAFVTVLRLRLDLATGAVTYADAGHGLTLVVRADGSSLRLPATGLPLGVDPTVPREVGSSVLHPGDLLVTFSDGILDAVGGSLDDLSRIEQAVRGADGVHEAVDAVLALATVEGPQGDDLTVVGLAREVA